MYNKQLMIKPASKSTKPRNPSSTSTVIKTKKSKSVSGDNNESLSAVKAPSTRGASGSKKQLEDIFEEEEPDSDDAPLIPRSSKGSAAAVASKAKSRPKRKQETDEVHEDSPPPKKMKTTKMASVPVEEAVGNVRKGRKVAAIAPDGAVKRRGRPPKQHTPAEDGNDEGGKALRGKAKTTSSKDTGDNSKGQKRGIVHERGGTDDEDDRPLPPQARSQSANNRSSSKRKVDHAHYDSSDAVGVEHVSVKKHTDTSRRVRVREDGVKDVRKSTKTPVEISTIVVQTKKITSDKSNSKVRPGSKVVDDVDHSTLVKRKRSG